jgi:hypothetical protein
MKAKELRIGNWVYDREDKCDIQIMDLDDLRYFMYYEPIPLTEEWFNRFGFYKEEVYYEEYNYKFKNQSFGEFYPKEDYYLPTAYYFSEAFGENFKLRYVHQLQNLYFALTGEELYETNH